MELWTAMSRAKRGFRDDVRLHVVATASLVVAFFCLGTALLSLENLNHIAARWGQSQHVTIYLRDNAQPADVAQLRLVLESLPEVAKAEHMTAAQARQEFAAQLDTKGDLGTLPNDAFPASLEITLADGVQAERVQKLAERVRQFSAVEDVETYREWFGQLATLLNAAKSGAGLLAGLVVICVLAVISNTIRLAVTQRRKEIEVLKLCGATDAYVRSPFLIEGAVEAAAAALLAVMLLFAAYALARAPIEATLTAMTGARIVFLSPSSMAALILGSAFVGALGSALSLRRHLTV